MVNSSKPRCKTRLSFIEALFICRESSATAPHKLPYQQLYDMLLSMFNKPINNDSQCITTTTTEATFNSDNNTAKAVLFIQERVDPIATNCLVWGYCKYSASTLNTIAAPRSICNAANSFFKNFILKRLQTLLGIKNAEVAYILYRNENTTSKH